MKDLLKKIMEKFDSEVLSEEARTAIEEELTSIIEDKVAAEKVLFVEEESKRYEEVISEKVKEVTEAGEAWKKTVLEKVEKASKELDSELEEKLAEQIKVFKEDVVQKVSDFLEYKLDEKIDDQKLGDAAKLAVYEPIVKGILGTLKENYVDVDEDSFELLKKAKGEIDSLESRLAEKVKENMDLSKKIKDAAKEEAFTKVTEGLTPEQMEKARLIMEDVEADDVEKKWENVKDVVLEIASLEEEEEEVETTEIETEGEEVEEEVDDELEEMREFKAKYDSNISRD